MVDTSTPIANKPAPIAGNIAEAGNINTTVSGDSGNGGAALPAGAPQKNSFSDNMNNMAQKVVLGKFNLKELIMPIGVMVILGIMLLPMPSWLLDMFLALSIGFSFIILISVIYAEKPTAFSVFPTILLLAALLRLSLNIASTRLILSHGHEGPDAAGAIIEAFGLFITGGNYLIGAILFIILIIINFVVITKGSGRIAEVAARFTLDAMPGKQLAIDADLSAGLIGEDEARAKRKELENDSKFFGSMDGASKFVRGDAVAGLLITAINVFGGIVIGVVQQNLSFEDALQIYTLLTVGDGLVTAIPSLVVSTSAGLLATKAGVEEKIDTAIGKQLTSNNNVLIIVSGALMFLAVIPGMPFFPFSSLSLVALGFYVYLFVQSRKEKEIAETQQQISEEGEEQVTHDDEPITNSLQIDLVRLELGYSLLTLLNEGQQTLTKQIKSLRHSLAAEYGFVVPAVRIQDNLEINGNEYTIKVKEIEEGRGILKPKMLMVLDYSGGKVNIQGEPGIEPVFKMDAVWINESQEEEARFRGYTVVDPCTIVITHLTEILKSHMADLLSFAETEKLLESLPEQQKSLKDSLIPEKVPLSTVQTILQNLLREQVSIRDLALILEAIAEIHAFTRNVMVMSEHVRQKLSRQLCYNYMGADGQLLLVTLSESWEKAFQESLQGQGEDKQFVMQPTTIQQFATTVEETFKSLAEQNIVPCLVCNATIRPYVYMVTNRIDNSIHVLSHQEIYRSVPIRTVGQI